MIPENGMSLRLKKANVNEKISGDVLESHADVCGRTKN
jgi:hypothetical protein